MDYTSIFMCLTILYQRHYILSPDPDLLQKSNSTAEDVFLSIGYSTYLCATRTHPPPDPDPYVISLTQHICLVLLHPAPDPALAA
eukprot:7716872-Ditylum_brightwellii.AAC.2